MRDPLQILVIYRHSFFTSYIGHKDSIEQKHCWK